jgi:hypothetical protein
VLRRFFLRAASLAALPLVPLASLAAQRTAPSERPTVKCGGQRVDDIVIYSAAPSVANLRRVPVVAQVARALHATTRPELIQRYLLLEPGQPCSELRRAESERILRAQPYIAEADIYIVPNDRGGVDVEVHTSDEASIVLGGSVRARAPNVTHVLLGNANLGGEGIYVSGSWRDGEGFRDGFAGRLIDHQFLGRPWMFGMEGERASLGYNWRIEGAHPFLTDLQRTAWRARGGMANGYVELRRPDGERPNVALERTYFDVGGIVRVGAPGRLSLFGASLTGNDERPGNRLVLRDTGFLADIGAVPRPYSAHRIARANLLWGVRDIHYVRREGLDALTAAQDVPIGFQLGTQFGRSLTVLGAREDDIFMAGDLYVGATSGIATARLQIQGEGRRGSGVSQWDGVLTTGRLTHYLKFSPRHLNQFNVEWSGGFRARTPFQLLFGVPEGGVRGYEESSLAGGQRVVARVEERFNVGDLLRAAEAGVAVFADAGRQWAGDVPFGVSTPVKTSVGVSLLAALPAHSARLWRADLAFPLSTGANARWTLRFTNADRTKFVFREPRDVAEGRELTMPSSIFAWP